MSESSRGHAGGGCGLAGVNVVERALTFDCCGERLVGVVSEPALAGKLGVVVVVGGPQYRVGSHRQFVLFARRLATEGVAVLRFDYRGMGDATGRPRQFEETNSGHRRRDRSISGVLSDGGNHCPMGTL